MNAVYSPVAYGNPRDNEVSNAQMNSTTRHLLKQNWPYISPHPASPSHQSNFYKHPLEYEFKDKWPDKIDLFSSPTNGYGEYPVWRNNPPEVVVVRSTDGFSGQELRIPGLLHNRQLWDVFAQWVNDNADTLGLNSERSGRFTDISANRPHVDVPINVLPGAPHQSMETYPNGDSPSVYRYEECYAQWDPVTQQWGDSPCFPPPPRRHYYADGLVQAMSALNGGRDGMAPVDAGIVQARPVPVMLAPPR